MEVKQRKSINDSLSKYDMYAKNDSFIEVTEWANKEGYDITITNNSDKQISLTFGELEAINYLVKSLEYSSN